MKTLLLAALLLASGGAVPAAASPAGDRAGCPQRVVREDGRAYGARARGYCRSRWDARLLVRQTGGRTHDEFVDGCLRRCIADRQGAPLDWFVGGVWAATLGYGVAAEGDGGAQSATPPASP